MTDTTIPPRKSPTLNHCQVVYNCSNEKLLKLPKQNLRSFRQCSFSFMAPSVWNSLPATFRNVTTLSQFKSHPRTFLFAQAFQQNLVLRLKKDGVSVWLVECRWMLMDREGVGAWDIQAREGGAGVEGEKTNSICCWEYQSFTNCCIWVLIIVVSEY